MQAYDLVIAKGGIKFHESQVEGDGERAVKPDQSRMTVEFKGMSAARFLEKTFECPRSSGDR